MKINILLPHKEKFDLNKASAVSITVKNNLFYSRYFDDIKVFGQDVENPIYKNNFIGVKKSFFSFKGKNHFLTQEMLKIILGCDDDKQIIEVHNRPYLINEISKKIKSFPISLFLHNDPKTMKGSKSIKERENILQKCAAVFCVSKFIKKQFLDGIKEDYKKVHVLYNGVDRKLKKFPLKQKEILFVGRLVFEKGVDLFIDVVKSIAFKFPDWSFILIGSSKLGENDNVNSYAYQVAEKFKTIGPQAKFYGFKDHDFVQEKMKNGSIIIIPSLWEEPFGLVAAEAMSNGLAIIASKVGGIPEIVEGNGILIDNINHKKLEETIIDLINNRDKREMLQKKAWDNFKLSSSRSSKKLDNFRKIIFQNHF
jgi:glycosyltransferase involved in cell wall biosynthesis